MRIAPLDQNSFTELQKTLFDRIAGRRGHVRGPYLCWLHRPELCDIVERLYSYFRWDSGLDTRISELAICITARHFDAAYPWAAHGDKAVAAGVAQSAIDQLAAGERPTFTNEDEEIFYRFASELLNDHFVSDATFAEAERLFGNATIVDLVGCIGAFSMLAMLLNTFRIPLHSGRPEPFPDIAGYQHISDRREDTV